MLVVQAKKGDCSEKLAALRDALSSADLSKNDGKEVLTAVRKCIAGLGPK